MLEHLKKSIVFLPLLCTSIVTLHSLSSTLHFYPPLFENETSVYPYFFILE
jgi:hypothetical protein